MVLIGEGSKAAGDMLEVPNCCYTHTHTHTLTHTHTYTHTH
jgi:hypothetical protein